MNVQSELEPAGASRRKAGRGKTPSRESLTPEVWLDAAIDLLENEGIDAVRVDVLAKRLGVTRGSFYWHFKDRDELLYGILKSWRLAATENLTRRLESASSDPREQLQDVLTLPFRGRSAARASRIELAIRAWARRDSMAKHAVDEADAARIAYIAQVFSSLGFGLQAARWRACIVYSVNVSSSLVGPINEMARPDEWLRQVEHLLVRRPLDP